MPANPSRPAIPPRERLIAALDVPTAADARALVEKLGDSVRFYKIGLELFMSGNYFELLDWLIARNKKVFVDLKFFDVPETVRSAVRALSSSGATFATIHGNQAIMEAAGADKGGSRVQQLGKWTNRSGRKCYHCREPGGQRRA